MEIKAEEVRNYQIFEGWAAGCDSKGCPGELDDRKRSPKKADAIKKALEASHPSTQPASTGAALPALTLDECGKLAYHLYDQEWANIGGEEDAREVVGFLAESIFGFLHHLAALKAATGGENGR